MCSDTGGDCTDAFTSTPTVGVQTRIVVPLNNPLIIERINQPFTNSDWTLANVAPNLRALHSFR